jgi:membrane fusion protein (multidrug efflux system)
MKTKFMLLSVCTFFLFACSTEKKEMTEVNTFPIINPIVMDTVYTNEYVADIHSVQNVEIRARVSGYIESIHVDEGKQVKAGQVLFNISSKEYEQALIKAKATLRSAEAEAKTANVELLNIKILVEKKIVSKSELEKAEAIVDATQGKIDEAKSDIANASLNLSLAEIKAPFDGVINRLPNKIGSLINEGTLLTTISNNNEVFAYFNVSEREYLDFISLKNKNKNKEVELVLANNEIHKYKGVVETVDGEFDKSTGNIAFRARFENPQGILRHGSTGKIKLKNEVKKAMIIPQKSTFEIQEKTYVFIVDNNNIVHSKSITPLLRLPNFYVIDKKGFSKKLNVLYEGIQNVKNGDKINVKKESLKSILSNQ